MVPIEDVNELKITWALPYYGTEVKKLHLKYFTFLLGHEGKNSILSYLKDLGYATFLQVQKKSILKQMTKFEVSIELTPKGLKNYIKVAEAVFYYVHKILDKGP